MYRLPIETNLDEDLICKYIKADFANASRKEKLRDYYRGKHDILNRLYEDASKPNNKIVNGFPKYISDSYCGYFMGTPVQYSSEDEDANDLIASITEYNDDGAENAKLAKEASITGSALEIVYLDADKEIRYIAHDGDFIAIYDDTIEAEMLWVIRYYSIDNLKEHQKTWYVDVFGRSDIRHYKSINPSASLDLVGIEPHFFGIVPCCVYLNNAEEQGDYEQVIPLIDAYNSVESDSVNNEDYFADAYLLMTNASLDHDDVLAMKENRVICLPENSSASFLVKGGNDVTTENVKNRLENDIHKFSGCPNMSDEAFGNNASGVALKYKLMTMENITSTKERYFKLGLQRRFELIANLTATYGSGFDWREIDIAFKRTLPVDESASADAVLKLGNLISDETKIAMLPYDLNPADEIEKKRNEAEAENALYFNANPFYAERDDLNGE